jgi:cysteine desulfurase/selenocysteine lyase
MNTDVIRKDFPILERLVHGKPLVYLDNAATTQKPKNVIEAITNYYYHHNANVHRGVHTLSDESTQAYEDARENVSRFIGAKHPHELIFVRNTTEAINLVAFSWAMHHLGPDDEILVTELEHHSNLVTWQRVCEATGAHLVYLPVDNNGALVIDYLESLVGVQTKLVAITHISNVTGTIVDIQHLCKDLKRFGSKAKILVDAAQSVPHMPVHVHDLGVDFLVFSGHKMLGPMGVGGLWAKREILEEMKPFLVGGGMIGNVGRDASTWADLPDKFDAGTPSVADAVGLAAACDYLRSVGMIEIQEYERELTIYGMQKLEELEREGMVTVYGPRDIEKRAGILTFNVNGVHAHDTAQILDREMGVAVRSGHHCNQIILEKLNAPATVRASFYLYNTIAEIDVLLAGIMKVRQIFKV